MGTRKTAGVRGASGAGSRSVARTRSAAGRRPVQGALPFRQRGGARPGAGRKPNGAAPLMARTTRPAHAAYHPALVTVKLRQHLPQLRNRKERAALLTLRCDPAREDNPCALGNRPEGLRTPMVLSLPGPVRFFNFAVYELLPITPARRARVEVRLIPETPASLVRAGDTDAFLDTRAATVVQAGSTIVLDMGVDDSREGWLYRGQLIKPGAPFSLVTERYRASGYVQSVRLTEGPQTP